MKDTNQPGSGDLGVQLARYGWAVGAGSLMAPAAMADGNAFDPPGGLPIVIDSSVNQANAIDVDLDGDTVNDYQFFFSTTYGGGFVVRTLSRGDGVANPRIQGLFGPCCDYARASRYEASEFIHPDDNATHYFDFSQNWFGFPELFIDNNGDVGSNVSPYTPFRDNPGFLGLSLGRTGINHGYAGTLQVVVNASGSQMTILSGSYKTDDTDIHLDDGVTPIDFDIRFQNGFESPQGGPYFPPGLGKLAEGAQD